MPGAPFRYGDRLTLRPIEPEDHAFLARHWNDPKIRHGTNRQLPTSEASLEGFSDDDAVYFLPCRDGDPVGLTWLFQISDVHGRGELGYWIAPDEEGQGYATEAARLCLGYAFDERNLRKVAARVFDYNTASQTILEKLGFREEGRLRDHYYIDGEYVDALFYGLFASDYDA